MQPLGSLGLPDGFSIDLPVLMDTGIDEMLLWLGVADPSAGFGQPFPVSGGRRCDDCAAAVAECARLAIFIYFGRRERSHGAVGGRMA